MRAHKSITFARTTVTTEHLREQTVCGSEHPDATFTELQVGDMLGVSRAPIREALTMPKREGLVEFDRRGTARVCEFDLDFHRLIICRSKQQSTGSEHKEP
jgi:DNA-binding GntR family transcriptional regulator